MPQFCPGASSLLSQCLNFRLCSVLLPNEAKSFELVLQLGYCCIEVLFFFIFGSRRRNISSSFKSRRFGVTFREQLSLLLGAAAAATAVVTAVHVYTPITTVHSALNFENYYNNNK